MIIEIICALFIILFVYAALTKLLDYEKFRIQIGQSPLLTAFAGWIAWIVPVTEFLISIMLVFVRLRLVGLYAAFSLMVMFTTYIVCILTLSLYIPCSCGGVLEKLGWKEHLIFNIVFIILAAVAVLISYKKVKPIAPVVVALS
ncbi:MauE/DoxX family redox-associated membrane protein [Dawidia soli]|nr:MauE/DoxX family redox-associated membrane protein [Dawidia soli]